jgi:hypothetical protein
LVIALMMAGRLPAETPAGVGDSQIRLSGNKQQRSNE